MNDPHHLPPFTRALLDFAKEARDDFCTPGHHSGALFEYLVRAAFLLIFY